MFSFGRCLYEAKDIPFWNSPGGLIVKTVLPLQGYDWLRVGFPCGSAGKEFACNAGDLGSIPELGRSPGEGKGYPLQESGLENSMDYVVHRGHKSRTRLSDFHFLSHCRGHAFDPWLGS